ncbi:MAG: 3-phosphoshikimate 1-carboxyvinyltransferase [bacterium]|nr:3-phosphoshikimate 1-carboxyvinyltransferase [bacterium]
MHLVVQPSKLGGEVVIPPSKSHTIRAVLIAALAGGRSRVIAPLDSSDTRAALAAARAFGADVEEAGDWRIAGVGGRPRPPKDVVDVANSGTTLLLGMGLAALCDGAAVFTGDAQTRRRPVQPLLDAYRALGADGFTTRGNGCAPLVLRGVMRGGRAGIRAVTSQYLSSLLISAPLARGDAEIEVPLLNEVPYVEMTLAWLDSLGVRYGREGWSRFRVPGGQAYPAFERRIPGDFSSATFFLCAAALTGSALVLRGLDMEDVQGDRAVVGMLRSLGAAIETSPDGLRAEGGALRGAELDLNATPDALPALAAAACFAEGETRLVNVPQAREKETDRIAVMATELRKMGGRVEELPDGLVVTGGVLRGAAVSGHHDHRVVMALAAAGLAARGRTVIDTAEAVAVTFPDFVEKMAACGADMRIEA